MDNPLRLKISHTTRYQYEQPVSYALQQMRLSPKAGMHQKIISWEMSIDGGKQELQFDDHNNNRVALVSVTPGGNSVSVVSAGEVEITDNGGVVGAHRGFTPLWYFLRSTPLTTPQANITKLVNDLGDNHDSEIARLHNLMALIANRVAYRTGTSNSTTTAAEALEARQGVCQDHSHIMISAARQLGHPARYVSGYLMMDDRISQDATHAWAEVHVDGIGWIGYDVSNGISPDQRYVRVATGLDYAAAAPVSGMRYGSGEENLSVSLQVQQQ